MERQREMKESTGKKETEGGAKASQLKGITSTIYLELRITLLLQDVAFSQQRKSVRF